jgi:predicted enzyme related to lactoylglutathione lyase
MNTVVHFEIPADRPEVVTKFFSDVFGWSFQKWGEEQYWLTDANSKDAKNAIGGAVMARKDPRQPMVNSIQVESIDAMVPLIERNGGKIVVAKMPVGDFGFLAYFTDPDGIIHGLWEVVNQG